VLVPQLHADAQQDRGGRVQGGTSPTAVARSTLSASPRGRLKPPRRRAARSWRLTRMLPTQGFKEQADRQLAALRADVAKLGSGLDTARSALDTKASVVEVSWRSSRHGPDAPMTAGELSEGLAGGVRGLAGGVGERGCPGRLPCALTAVSRGASWVRQVGARWSGGIYLSIYFEERYIYIYIHIYVYLSFFLPGFVRWARRSRSKPTWRKWTRSCETRCVAELWVVLRAPLCCIGAAGPRGGGGSWVGGCGEGGVAPGMLLPPAHSPIPQPAPAQQPNLQHRRRSPKRASDASASGSHWGYCERLAVAVAGAPGAVP
jgi:hypothetical protein